MNHSKHLQIIFVEEGSTYLLRFSYTYVRVEKFFQTNVSTF